MYGLTSTDLLISLRSVCFSTDSTESSALSVLVLAVLLSSFSVG